MFVMSSKSARKGDTGPEKNIDPSLALLFDSSFGAVKPPAKPTRIRPLSEKNEPDNETDEEGNDEVDEDERSSADRAASQVSEESEPEAEPTKKIRKRKRDDNEDLEGAYLKKLQAQEAAEEKQRDWKKSKTDSNADSEPEDVEDADAQSKAPVPKHETLVSQKDEELDKANRSIFLGNVPTAVISSKSDYKQLKHFFSTCGKISSIRFRSIAFSEQIPRKAAFVNHKLHEKQKTVNAYIVYKEVGSVRDALKLNGSVLLDYHIRVDSVAHPAKHECRRCVFIGNLDFEAQEEKLWRHFAKCGKIENVRVVRDAKTNVGKGFAYVQFEDAMAVDQALLLDGQKMEGDRKLRVSRAKSIKRKDKPAARRPEPKSGKIYVPKVDPKQRDIIGRASKLLGRAGASQLKKQSEIFEGMRATEKTDPGLKKGGTGKTKGKPRARTTARSAAWKKKSAKGAK